MGNLEILRQFSLMHSDIVVMNNCNVYCNVMNVIMNTV